MTGTEENDDKDEEDLIKGITPTITKGNIRSINNIPGISLKEEETTPAIHI